MTWKHIVFQYMFTLFYMVVTAIWQISTGDAVIFPERLDWICATRPGDPPSDCLFSQCILWFLYFVLVQTGCFVTLHLTHFVKSKYCCRKSLDIPTYSEVDTDKLGAVSKKE